MSISIQDEATITTLASLSTSEDVLTPEGRLLGRFTPATACKMTFPEFGKTDEELDREEADPHAIWYTPEEVMARLRSLTKET